MTFPTITQAELEAVGVVGLADTPGLDARAMQEKFEETSRALLAPKYNELTSLLESEQGAQAGCAVPAGLPADTPATVQGVVNALDAAIDRKVQALGAGDMAQAVYDPAHLGADVTVQPYAHTKTGTVHALTGAGANGRVRMTADVAEGDTVTVNGKAVPAYVGAEEFAAALAGQPLTGRWLSFVFDGAQVNFKGGGGAVTVEGLAAENIVAGQTVTVKQGAKTVAQVTGSNGENKLGLLAYIPLSKNTTYNYPVEAPKITQGILDESYFAIQNDALVCLKSCKVKITAYTVLGGTSEAINNPAANEAYISLNGSRLLSCNVGEGDGTWYGSYVLYKRYDTTTMTLKSGDKITRGAESYWVFPPEILIEQA